jgi:hypothetical protein
MSVPKLNANQRMKAQAEGSMLMALFSCVEAIESGNAADARTHARTVARFAFMLTPKLRKYIERDESICNTCGQKRYRNTTCHTRL